MKQPNLNEYIPSKFSNNVRAISQCQIFHSSNDKIKSFREREEQKEAEYNQTPDLNTSVKEDDGIEAGQSSVVKIKILAASLPFVEGTENCGWTRKALVRGAESVGYPGVIHGVFSRGGVELINYYYLKCNQRLMDEMQIKTSEVDKALDPKVFVRWALQHRLSMYIPFIKSWPQALSIMTLPQNVPTSFANLLTLVDDVCYFTGDRSVDVSFQV